MSGAAAAGYPALTGQDFPPEATSYSVPLQWARQRAGSLVLFSVDWEKDHGKWRRGGPSPTYAGIQLATSVLCSVLDELEIPCTWFVECNSEHPDLDMAVSCPEQLAEVTARGRDEIGLHVHWGNHYGKNAGPVDLYDRGWVQNEIASTSASLRKASGAAVTAFRSGGHTLVRDLPQILASLGYRADCSVEDRRPYRMRVVQTFFGLDARPFRPSPAWANQRGRLDLVEIPTSLHLHDFTNLERIWNRLFPPARKKVVSLYLHIDELTVPGKDELEPARVQGVKNLLVRLRREPQTTFVTASQCAGLWAAGAG